MAAAHLALELVLVEGAGGADGVRGELGVVGEGGEERRELEVGAEGVGGPVCGGAVQLLGQLGGGRHVVARLQGAAPA